VKLQASVYIKRSSVSVAMWPKTNHIVADVEFRCKLYLL